MSLVDKTYKSEDIIALFNQTFFDAYNTKLVRGEDEPIYLPATDSVPYHQIVFAHGFYASAMHEIFRCNCFNA